MDLDDLEPRPREAPPLSLDSLSIEDLEARIVRLEAEIARARAAIAQKRQVRAGAEAVFRR